MYDIKNMYFDYIIKRIIIQIKFGGPVKQIQKKEGFELEKRLIDKLKNIKHEYDVVQVVLFNNGNIKGSNLRSSFKEDELNNKKAFERFEYRFMDAVDNYSQYYSFDTVSMDLNLGIIYNSEDVNDKYLPKDESVEPIQDIVRFSTGHSGSYLNDEKTNSIDYNDFKGNIGGYIDYNYLVSMIENSGLSFEGPKTFEVLKERILSGEVFDISISANLVEKENSLDENKKIVR